MIELSVFRKFPTIAQAKEVEILLNKNGIETKLADNIAAVDITFSGSTLQNEYEIKINNSDFQKAEQILAENAEMLIDQVDKDYYLFEFTNEELYEILLKSDEWNMFDYKLAQKLLIERGKPIDKDLISSLKKQRLELLAKPEENQKPWIIAGYILSILGGFVGLIIGYLLWTSTKTLPNGEKVHSYSLSDRNHGKNIFYIGIIVLPIVLIIRIFYT